MDKNKDAKLNYDEFVEGSKQDPTIVQVKTPIIYRKPLFTYQPRRCHYMMAWCNNAVNRPYSHFCGLYPVVGFVIPIHLFDRSMCNTHTIYVMSFIQVSPTPTSTLTEYLIFVRIICRISREPDFRPPYQPNCKDPLQTQDYPSQL